MKTIQNQNINCSASTGNRTRITHVAGEYSAIEPSMLCASRLNIISIIHHQVIVYCCTLSVVLHIVKVLSNLVNNWWQKLEVEVTFTQSKSLNNCNFVSFYIIAAIFRMHPWWMNWRLVIYVPDCCIEVNLLDGLWIQYLWIQRRCPGSAFWNVSQCQSYLNHHCRNTEVFE